MSHPIKHDEDFANLTAIKSHEYAAKRAIEAGEDTVSIADHCTAVQRAFQDGVDWARWTRKVP